MYRARSPALCAFAVLLSPTIGPVGVVLRLCPLGVEIQLPCIVIKRRSVCWLRELLKSAIITRSAPSAVNGHRGRISASSSSSSSSLFALRASASPAFSFFIHRVSVFFPPSALPPAQGCNCTVRHSDTWACDRLDFTSQNV